MHSLFRIAVLVNFSRLQMPGIIISLCFCSSTNFSSDRQAKAHTLLMSVAASQYAKWPRTAGLPKVSSVLRGGVVAVKRDGLIAWSMIKDVKFTHQNDNFLLVNLVSSLTCLAALTEQHNVQIELVVSISIWSKQGIHVTGRSSE